MSTIQERLAPFDWCELEKDTEFYVPPRVVSEVSVRLLDELLSIYCDDYDDTYDNLPAWEAQRLPKGCGYFDRKDRRSAVVTKRNSKFISKTKENK